MMEVYKTSTIYPHFITLHLLATLTAQTRRHASRGAVEFLMSICQKDSKTRQKPYKLKGW